jgi:hypothetical protein
MSESREKRTPGPLGERAANDVRATDALLSPPLRAALMRELTPTRADRERVQTRIAATLAGAPVSAAVEKVDDAMATRAVRLKTATTVASKSFVSKLVVSGLLLAGAAAITLGALRRGDPPPSAAATVTQQPAASPAESPAVGRSASPSNETAPSQVPDSASAPVSSPIATLDSAAEVRPRAAVRTRTRRAAAGYSNRSAAAVAKPARAAMSQPPTAATVSGVSGTSDASNVLPSEAASTTALSPASELADELALVRAASDAVDRADAVRALALLSSYAQRYPRGSLQTEAQALRAIALCASKQSGATAARDAFLSAHARSALAQRVRNTCQ